MSFSLLGQIVFARAAFCTSARGRCFVRQNTLLVPLFEMSHVPKRWREVRTMDVGISVPGA